MSGRVVRAVGRPERTTTDPELTITDPWLQIFTAGYVLVGIGILVEIARRIGMGFITARAELDEEKRKAKRTPGSTRPQ